MDRQLDRAQMLCKGSAARMVRDTWLADKDSDSVGNSEHSESDNTWLFK